MTYNLTQIDVGIMVGEVVEINGFTEEIKKFVGREINYVLFKKKNQAESNRVTQPWYNMRDDIKPEFDTTKAGR